MTEFSSIDPVREKDLFGKIAVIGMAGVILSSRYSRPLKT